MEDAPSPRGPGRPPHEPTPETRALVLDLVAKAADIATIAEAVGISEPTLHARYADEIQAARPQQNFPFPEFQAPAPERTRRPHAGGRPSHVPTAETRDQVEILVASGMRVWQIAKALGITEPTLNEHYPDELDGGKAKKTAMMVLAQYRSGIEGNVSAQKAWLGQNLAIEKAPPSRQGVPAHLGKKEAAQHAAKAAATGKFATPAPPKLVVNNH
jgi:hypothetical protein